MKGLGRLIGRAYICRRFEADGARYISRRLLFVSSTKSNAFSHFTSWKPATIPSPYPTQWSNLIGQTRTMFIQTQSTPNPSSLMFYPGKPVMDVGSADFPNARSAMNSPLAKALYGVDGITRVFFGSEFITVTKSEDASWDLLKPEIFAAIMDFYSSGQPLFLDANSAAAKDTAIKEDDSETVAMIKELLETRIRPAVQDDGGDIEYIGFDQESGIVKLRMQGACSGCPSSSVTLKSGIENMLMHYVPEWGVCGGKSGRAEVKLNYSPLSYARDRFPHRVGYRVNETNTCISFIKQTQVKGVEQEFDAEDENAELTGQMD